MTDQVWIKLATDLAWPIVALVAIIVLGPMGLLEKYIKTISENIGALSKAVADFKETVLNIKPELERMASQSREISSSVSGSINDLEARVNQMTDRIGVVSTGVSAMLRQMAAGETDSKTIFSDTEEVPASEPAFTFSTDQLFSRVQQRWRDFVATLRKISGDPDDFDARMIGEMANQQADRRRKNAIPKELAQEIADLHSKYKRWTRLKATKDQWLTSDLVESFVSNVEGVEGRLKAARVEAASQTQRQSRSLRS